MPSSFKSFEIFLDVSSERKRERAAAQVSDGDRRVDQGGAGDRGRRPVRSGRVIEVLSRLVSERGAPRYLRSDNGPEFVARTLLGVDRRPGHRDRPNRPRQALAERRRRELQWQVPRRVLEHGMVPLARRGQGHHRSLAPPLQRGPPAFKHQLFDAGRVRREASTDQRSSRFRNGPGRCATRGLRAQARCSTVLEGTIERPGDAGSLNLSVVRRIRAGHSRFSRDPL
jgi:hypothetical protein